MIPQLARIAIITIGDDEFIVEAVEYPQADGGTRVEFSRPVELFGCGRIELSSWPPSGLPAIAGDDLVVRAEAGEIPPHRRGRFKRNARRAARRGRK